MGEEGAVEFLELRFRDVEIIVGRVVGVISGSFEDGTKDLIGNSGCVGC